MRRLSTGLVAVGVYTTVIMAAVVAFLAATLYSSADGHLGGYGVEVESDSRAAVKISLENWVLLPARMVLRLP